VSASFLFVIVFYYHQALFGGIKHLKESGLISEAALSIMDREDGLNAEITRLPTIVLRRTYLP